jgi:hypothetical protein
MKVTVFHNVSRDASFGFNSVWRKAAERPAGVPEGRAYQDEKTGEWSWKSRAQTVAEQHELVRVYEYEADPDDVENDCVLERAWDSFNFVGGSHEDREDPAYFARKLRSLSVGDVLALDDGQSTQYWSCDSFGWTQRREDECRVLTAAQARFVVRERYDFRPAEELTVTVPWTGVTQVAPNVVVIDPAHLGEFLAEVTASASTPFDKTDYTDSGSCGPRE